MDNRLPYNTLTCLKQYTAHLSISTYLNCDEIRAFIRILIFLLLTHAVILQTLFRPGTKLQYHLRCLCMRMSMCLCGSVATAFYSTLFDNMQVTKMFIHKLIICNKMNEGTQNLQPNLYPSLYFFHNGFTLSHIFVRIQNN